MSRVDYSQKIEDQFTTHKITWRIPKFSNLIDKSTSDEIHCNEYNLVDTEEDSEKPIFKLKIRFSGRKNYIMKCYYRSLISVVVKTILLDLKSCVTLANEYQTVYANTWQCIKSFGQNEYSRHLTSYDELCLEFKFIVINDVHVKSIEDCQFTDDFNDLYECGLYSDMVMKSADNMEFKVHKAVLASRSVVLKAHFEHNTIECQTNIVSSPLDSDVLHEVLTFIYSNKTSELDEMPEKLLAAGDYYQLRNLKNLASQTLYDQLTVDNAIETLQLANLHSAPNLKKWTLEYIKSVFSSVKRTEGWAKLKSVELTKTICEYITTEDVETD